jgi:putative protein-disulfide isomerase
MKPIIYYFYDAHCGWCYGFSDVMKKVFGMYNNIFQFKVISGELIDRNSTTHFAEKASYILGAYKRVEEHTGIIFGDKYVHELQNATQSTIQCNSLVPAHALNVFRYFYPNTLINFAAAIQKAHYVDAQDLTKFETYKAIAEHYHLPLEDFEEQWNSDAQKALNMQDLDFCKQYQISGYPALALQVNEEAPLQLFQNGWGSYEDISGKLDAVIKDLNL